nr:MAG TPA: hypothetical protein [Bacteriophage sp.]
MSNSVSAYFWEIKPVLEDYLNTVWRREEDRPFFVFSGDYGGHLLY